jgi:hypothetical protein
MMIAMAVGESFLEEAVSGFDTIPFPLLPPLKRHYSKPPTTQSSSQLR